MGHAILCWARFAAPLGLVLITLACIDHPMERAAPDVIIP